MTLWFSLAPFTLSQRAIAPGLHHLLPFGRVGRNGWCSSPLFGHPARLHFPGSLGVGRGHRLSSSQWNVSRSNDHHIQAWPMKTFTRCSFLCSHQSTEWRILQRPKAVRATRQQEPEPLTLPWKVAQLGPSTGLATGICGLFVNSS